MSRDIYSPFLGRSYPDPAGAEERAWQALGQLMHNLLNPEPSPGPPYAHTIVPPAPCPTGCDDDCELNPDGCHEWHAVPSRRDHDPEQCEASRQPGPAFTLTEQQ